MSFSSHGGKSNSESKSQMLTSDQVASYYGKLNQLSGGRLAAFAEGGTTPVSYDGVTYNAPTADDFRALGGAGATRIGAAERARAQAVDELAADPNLSVAQRQRSRQLVDDDYNSRLDAINKETEAMLMGAKMESDALGTSVQQEEALRRYMANAENAKLTAQDMELLANIYFGGTGSQSRSNAHSWNTGSSGSFNFMNNS
jgi:hypothetical protein